VHTDDESRARETFAFLRATGLAVFDALESECVRRAKE